MARGEMMTNRRRAKDSARCQAYNLQRVFVLRISRNSVEKRLDVALNEVVGARRGNLPARATGRDVQRFIQRKRCPGATHLRTLTHVSDLG